MANDSRNDNRNNTSRSPQEGTATGAPPGVSAGQKSDDEVIKDLLAADAAKAEAWAKKPEDLHGASVVAAQATAQRVLRLGDVKVRCLKDQTQARLGERSYALKAGKEIFMDRGHAAELAETGWVVEVS